MWGYSEQTIAHSVAHVFAWRTELRNATAWKRSNRYDLGHARSPGESQWERHWSRQIFKWGPEHQAQSQQSRASAWDGDRNWMTPGPSAWWGITWAPRHQVSRIRSESTDGSPPASEACGQGNGISLDVKSLQINLTRKSAFQKSGEMQSLHLPPSQYCTHCSLCWTLHPQEATFSEAHLRAALIHPTSQRVTFYPFSLPCFFLQSTYDYLIYFTHYRRSIYWLSPLWNESPLRK